MKKILFLLHNFSRLTFVAIILTLFSSLSAQCQIRVEGIVKDENGSPLFGVNILVKGTNANYQSNINGKFVATSNNIDTLVLTAVGFVTQEFIINNQSEIIVSLIKNLKSLDEVVLTGYTGQRRKDITGAVSVVEVENLKGIPSGSAMQALQGLASGVNVISTGVPGSQSKIFIRGVSSFGSTQPLVLVDGVQADINNVSSDDIQSMQVKYIFPAIYTTMVLIFTNSLMPAIPNSRP